MCESGDSANTRQHRHRVEDTTHLVDGYVLRTSLWFATMLWAAASDRRLLENRWSTMCMLASVARIVVSMLVGTVVCRWPNLL